ncbi:MAG TPA: hypothetical protein ENH07_06535 [Nitrospirae bacterium]|nr:hypothetical protein [Nitrospirota bacterium]HDY72012.1 hypothetical protein [Nitrospirota bacterium]
MTAINQILLTLASSGLWSESLTDYIIIPQALSGPLSLMCDGLFTSPSMLKYLKCKKKKGTTIMADYKEFTEEEERI